LPENFNRPYLQENLSHFWNNWHMTLTNWFRAYLFNPLTRALRKDGRLSQTSILFFTQLATMLLIGMWHGVSWNFLIWGAWHGLGLFVHNRWSAWTQPIMNRLDEKPVLSKSVRVINVLLTYHYVTLGWIWFVLPHPAAAISFIATLFGQG
jgi:alginate O-acetyltransferase complex protein AlgI